MRKTVVLSACVALLMLGAAATTRADIPQLINYQGILLDGNGDPVTLPVSVVFGIWNDPTAGDLLWSETQNVTPDDDGLFNVLLGSVSLIPDSAFVSTGAYLSTKAGADPESVPRTRLVASAYSFTANYAKRAEAEVPIGTVIDWWRPDASFPVPEGYEICDGSVVTDPESPLNGYALPDLRDVFVSGAATVGDIGAAGGTLTHSHTYDPAPVSHTHDVDPPNTASSVVDGHMHDVDPPNAMSTVEEVSHTHPVDVPSIESSSDTHSHRWSLFEASTRTWYTYNSSGNLSELYDWGDGMDSGGEGDYPLSRDDHGGSYYFFTDASSHNHSHDHPSFTSGVSSSTSHAHSVDIGSFSSSSAGSHSHTVDIGSFVSGSASVDLPEESSSVETVLPPYVQLLKIMRIK